MESRSDPEALVAIAIGDLPERFEDFTVRDLVALREVSGTLLELYRRANEDENAVFDRLRVDEWAPDKTLGDVATEVEFAEVNAAVRSSLAIERAQMAWNAYERRIGVPWQVPELQMTTSEDLDGSLVMLDVVSEGESS